MNFAMSKDNKEPITHTTQPIYVGSSVIGMKYKNGVIIAADTRLNYGSMCKLVNIEDRIQQLTPRTLIGYSGEDSDLQETSRQLHALALSDTLEGSPCFGPVEIANYLASLHYYKRNKMNPYLNSVVTGGVNWNGEMVLMNIDPFGTLLEANYFTTSMAHYFCNSLIKPQYPKDPNEMTKEKAMHLLNQCFEVLFYRHTMAGNEIKYATIEKDGDDIKYGEGKFTVESKWNYDQFKNQANEAHYLTC